MLGSPLSACIAGVMQPELLISPGTCCSIHAGSGPRGAGGRLGSWKGLRTHQLWGLSPPWPTNRHVSPGTQVWILE